MRYRISIKPRYPGTTSTPSSRSNQNHVIPENLPSKFIRDLNNDVAPKLNGMI